MSSASTSTLPATSYWRRAWDDAQTQLQQANESARSLNLNETSSGFRPLARVLRVGQLDAELLDQELLQLLQTPLSKALGLLNSVWRAKTEPELTLFLQLLLYKFSIWDTGASYGARLQNLRYKATPTNDKISPSGLSRKVLAAHGALTILVPYLHTRIRNRALSRAWPDLPAADRRRKAWALLTNLENIHTSMSLIGFLAFMWNGRYRTLADRILSLRLVPINRLTNREVSYEFMNRQMVWHAFTEFLLFILPLLTSRAVRRTTKQIKQYMRTIDWSSIQTFSGGSKQPRQIAVKKGPYADFPTDQCAICASNASFTMPGAYNSMDFGFPMQSQPTPVASSTEDGQPLYPINIPYLTSCGHVYCYYCLSDKVIRTYEDGDDAWECLRCTEPVRECHRLTAVEEAVDVDDWNSDIDDMPSFTTDMSLEDSN